MQIKDLIILGRACPEPLKDGRVTVCLAGWSETLGFVRLYPTRRDMPGKRWDIIQVEVEKNDQDTRMESWKIAGSKSDWEKLSDKIEVISHISNPSERRNVVGNLVDISVNDVNAKKRSLGIVKPNIVSKFFKENAKYGELFQKGLPGFTELDDVKVKRDFPYEPRVKYTCPDDPNSTTEHNQQVLEWGFYEWLRKEPDKKEQVWENAGFDKDNTAIYFLIGNQFRYRNSFMVVSVLRFPTGHIEKSMFPYRKLPPNDLIRDENEE